MVSGTPGGGGAVGGPAPTTMWQSEATRHSSSPSLHPTITAVE